MTCRHQHTTSGERRCFTGSVAVSPYTEENRAAHGGVTYTETCGACGARRAVNVNQRHVEVGPWGPSRAARRARADRLSSEAAAAVAAVAPVNLTRGDGMRATVRVDEEGMICVDTDREHNDGDIDGILAAIPAFVEAAQAARRACIAAEAARREASE